MYRLMLAALCCLVFSSHARPLSAAILTDFEQQFQQLLQQAKVPGGAYAVVQGDRIVATGAYGVRQQGEHAKVTPDTVFRLASVSKTFAAALLVQQAQRQQLDLNAPLQRFVPSFQLGQPRASAALTVDHVLSQSSGLMPHAFEDLLEAGQTPKQIMPKFRRLSNVCPVGRCYSYQNVLFGYLEQVLLQSQRDSLPQRDYAQLMQQQILTPLQMRSTSVGLEGYLASANKAVPHRKTATGWLPLAVLPEFYRVKTAAGVNASARDMARYLIAMLGHQPSVLSSAMLQQLRTPKVPVSNRLKWPVWRHFKQASSWYGRGWRIVQFDTHRLYYHGGVVDGFRPYIAYSSEQGVGLVLLINAESDVISDIAKGFWQQILL